MKNKSKFFASIMLLLTMGIGQVWGDETIFSVSCKVTSDVTVSKETTDQSITSSQADITGGSMYVSNGETSDKKLLLASAGPSGDKKAAFSITNGTTIFKIVLSQSLAAGDVISSSFFVGSDKDGDDGLWFSTSSTRPSSAPTAKAVKTTPSGWNDVTYTVTTGDGICGESTIYVHRATATTTNFTSLAIHRPSSGGEEEPGGNPEDPEDPDDCPESGVVLSMTMNQVTDDTKKSLTASEAVNLGDSYASVTGGTATFTNTGSAKGKIDKANPGLINFDGNAAYLILDLECPVKTGDVISIVNTTSVEMAFTTSATLSATYKTATADGVGTFTVPAALNNVDKLYCWRATSSGLKFSALTITRPYSVSFESAKGTVPTTPAKAVSLTLEEITGVDGWTHSGWTADKTVKVGGENKTAGTVLAVDATVTLTDNTTFTAVWEEAVETFTVTFKDGESTLGTQDVASGEKATALSPAPTKAGNSFDYWYKVTGESGQEDVEYDFNTAVTDDMTLMAHWTELDDDATLSYLEVDGESVPVPADGIYRMVAAYGHNPQVTAATTASSGASRVIYNIPTHSDQEGGYDYVQVTVTAHDGVTVKYYQIRYTHAPKLGVEIIKATHTGAKTASVTGYIGGSADKSTQDNGKLGSNGHYFGIQLASGNFQSGDIVAIKASVLNGGNTATLFTDKGNTALVSGAFNTVDNMYYYTLEAEVEKIYLYRATSACNPNVEYMAVYRSMNPFIASFKFGDDAATINQSAKTISIDVPYGTDVTALTPTLETYGNGGSTYTPTGAQDFTNSVNYVVTDGYDELSTTYAVTVNVATPSTNAYLASLSVAGYALDFDKETTTYTIVLDYGTTALPAITYEVEDTGLAEAVKVEGGVNGATTITVTPEAGADHEKVYTINFSVSTSPKFVIFDGSTMTRIASATFTDESTGFSYSMASSIPLTGDAITGSWNGKNYTKAVKGFKPTDNVNNIVSFIIPEGYLAKVCLVGTTNSSGNERKMFIALRASKKEEDALDNYILTSSTFDAVGLVTNLLLPGTYYLGSTEACRLFEFSIQLYEIDDYRPLPQGMLSTTCQPNGGVMVGASIYEIAYMDFESDGTTPHKIYFDEVVGGVMEAGMPYVVLVNENSAGMYVVYTDNANKATGLSHNGLVGYLGDTKALDENDYFIYNNLFYYVSDADASSGRILISSNRAYINLSEVPTSAPAPAPGRRRVALGNGNSAPMVATAIDNAQTDSLQCTKVLIDGQLFILRGEKMYDVTGRIVK